MKTILLTILALGACSETSNFDGGGTSAYEQQKYFDQQGNPVDKDGNLIDEEGNRIYEKDKIFNNDGDAVYENGNPNDDADFESVGENIKTTDDVKNLCDNGTIEVTDTITFDPTDDIERCDFKEDKKDSHVSDFYRQVETFELPAGALACGLKLESTNDNIIYDDIMFMTLDSYLVFGSRTATTFKKKNGFVLYDWNAIKGERLPRNEEKAHCAMGNECKVPATKTVGKFDVKISPVNARKLALELKGKSSFDLKLIVTGDNDKKDDCQHSGASFKVTLKYVQLQN
jgi:hypothetical protein